jgi:hypothetical protein
VAQTNPQSLIGTLLEQSASLERFLGVEPRTSNDRFDAIQSVVTLREKVLETKTLSREDHNSLAITLSIGTTRRDWGLRRARGGGLQTFFRMMHVSLAFYQ